MNLVKLFLIFNFLFFLQLFASSLDNIVIIDDFNSYAKLKFPSSWKVRNSFYYKDPSSLEEKTWFVEEDQNNLFLKAHSVKNSITIGKKVNVDIKKYPFLSWKWRVIKNLSKEANEKHKTTNDSIMGIYVLFKRFPLPISIKYVVSMNLNKGEVFSSPYFKNSKIKVIKKFEDNMLNNWITEKENVLEDYKKIFNDDDPQVVGIALLTDSDNTKGEVITDYDDIFFTKE